MDENEKKIHQVLLALDGIFLAYDGDCPNSYYSGQPCQGIHHHHPKATSSGRYFYSNSVIYIGKVFTPCEYHLEFYVKEGFKEYIPGE